MNSGDLKTYKCDKQNLKVEFFRDYNTFLTWYMFGK